MVENKNHAFKNKTFERHCICSAAAVNCADADTGGVNGGWSACNGFSGDTVFGLSRHRRWSLALLSQGVESLEREVSLSRARLSHGFSSGSNSSVQIVSKSGMKSASRIVQALGIKGSICGHTVEMSL